MKFDCIVMNPPYQKNLHLKILAEAIKHLKDDDSKVVNLSPIRWLQDPLAKYKKNSDFNRFKESIRNDVSSIDVYTSAQVRELFDNDIKQDLGIYVCVNQNNNMFDWDSIPLVNGKCLKFVRDLFKKISNKQLDSISEHIQAFSNKNASNFTFIITLGNCDQTGTKYDTRCIVRTGRFGPFTNDKYNGLTAKEVKALDKRSVWGNVDNWMVACFNTAEQNVNFFNSERTIFKQFLTWAFTSDQHIPLQFLPWMGDSINPRTGLKGYESEWTDEDFAEYFSLTPEEFNEIKKTMEKYK